MHIHVLGICGTFMAGLAALATELGHKVTGCDQNVYPPMSTFLDSLGISVIEGYDESQLSLKPDLFIIGNVVSRGNSLMEAILNQNHYFQSGPEWLYQNILKGKWVIAVSGTHGKTTTSSMINWILRDNGIDCGYLIGGIPGNFKRSSQLSKSDSPFFVIEADEYDTAFFDKRSKFVHYHPKTLVINNIEFDHADIFEDLNHIQKHFHQLIRIIPKIGKILANDQDENIKKTLAMGVWSELDNFNSEQSLHIKKNENGQLYYKNHKIGELSKNLVGEHNKLNALAAISAVKHVGISEDKALTSLAGFKNTARRLELIYQSKSLKIYDDFAHHPTAIEFIVKTFQEEFNKEKTLFIVDPRSNTMKRGDLKEHLRWVLSSMQSFILYSKDLHWDADEFMGELKHGFISSQVNHIMEKIKQVHKQYNNIVFVSNGSFDGLQKKVVHYLEHDQL
ncbi:MAG: UDP-N-acetylmuramate:L-alanyl-gamma-D-glutamyl-meso-diaminopimelate ligase [Proteobacteria bacterium]|nr:UDP-N-acetylmuramate:L-alanyl-gamma-D-glutamyl-meso-diaminopimelate ligase [Pseudomonadota bacterium]